MRTRDNGDSADWAGWHPALVPLGSRGQLEVLGFGPAALPANLTVHDPAPFTFDAVQKSFKRLAGRWAQSCQL